MWTHLSRETARMHRSVRLCTNRLRHRHQKASYFWEDSWYRKTSKNRHTFWHCAQRTARQLYVVRSRGQRKSRQFVFVIFAAIAGTAGPRDVRVRELRMCIGKKPREFPSDRSHSCHKAANRIHFRFRTAYESDSSLIWKDRICVSTQHYLCYIQAKNLSHFRLVMWT